MAGDLFKNKMTVLEDLIELTVERYNTVLASSTRYLFMREVGANQRLNNMALHARAIALLRFRFSRRVSNRWWTWRRQKKAAVVAEDYDRAKLLKQEIDALA